VVNLVIKIIKNSKDVELAKKTLINKKWKITRTANLIKLLSFEKSRGGYSLSESQVISILELRLQKLTAFAINEIETEIKKLPLPAELGEGPAWSTRKPPQRFGQKGKGSGRGGPKRTGSFKGKRSPGGGKPFKGNKNRRNKPKKD